MTNKKKILVLSSYPPTIEKGVEGISGLGRYLKKILENIKDHQFTVLREKYSDNDVKEAKDDNGNNIIPIWKNDSPISVFKALKYISRKEYSHLIINHDFGAFGGVYSAIIFPLFVILARLKIKNIIFIQHSGLTDLKSISGHLQLKENSIKLKVYSLGIKINLIVFSLFTSKLVVLEGLIKERFIKLPFIKDEKIVVIHNPMYKPEIKEYSNKVLPKDKYNVLYFGFLTWYKGADWIANATLDPKWPKNVHLTLAGGKTPNMDNEAYYTDLLSIINKSNRITHTGFLPQEDVYKYFIEADLVIFPYRALMAASGPFSYALSYNKPFILSDSLEKYLKEEDIQVVLKEKGININNLLYKDQDENDLFRALETLSSDSDLKNRVILASKEIAEARNIDNISNMFMSLLNK